MATLEMRSWCLPKRCFPRLDVCESVVWDLKAWAGRMVCFEMVDGDTGGAYAWLGVTRFDVAGLAVAGFAGADERGKGLQTLATLLKVTAPADLRDRLRPYLPEAAVLAPVPEPAERKKLDEFIAARAAGFGRKPGDAAAGERAFATHCAVCHQVGGVGGLVGPQLDGIGARGVARLCEDILDPNRNVDGHFQMTVISMKDGTTVAGMVRGESGAVVVVTDVAGADHRLIASEIARREGLALSLMSAGFGERIGEAEFADLLSYLLGQKGR